MSAPRASSSRRSCSPMPTQRQRLGLGDRRVRNGRISRRVRHRHRDPRDLCLGMGVYDGQRARCMVHQVSCYRAKQSHGRPTVVAAPDDEQACCGCLSQQHPCGSPDQNVAVDVHIGILVAPASGPLRQQATFLVQPLGACLRDPRPGPNGSRRSKDSTEPATREPREPVHWSVTPARTRSR